MRDIEYHIIDPVFLLFIRILEIKSTNLETLREEKISHTLKRSEQKKEKTELHILICC